MKELGRIITLPKIFDPRGNLTVAEGETHIPFAIARTYWTYDVPGGESRGGPAHKECQEFIIAASGSFSVTLDNESRRRPIISTILGRDCSWMSISGEHLMISLPAHYAWFWLPKSLKRKTIYANMTNISDS